MKKLISFLLFLFIIINLTAQNLPEKEIKAPWTKKIFFGGDLGLQFGNTTFINVSPIVGYKFTEKIVGGIGITYQYLNYKDADYSTNIYGGSLFGRYYITESLFAHAEYQVLSFEPYNYYTFSKAVRTNIESYLIGGGYKQAVSGNISFNIMVLWNLSNSIYSPYTNPVIRAGFDIGL